VPAARPAAAKPRILCIGAHPDDAESGAAGTAALWIAKGYPVKFVAMTNGDIGHEILDNHDGELLPTLENRKAVTRLIRE